MIIRVQVFVPTGAAIVRYESGRMIAYRGSKVPKTVYEFILDEEVIGYDDGNWTMFERNK